MTDNMDIWDSDDTVAGPILYRFLRLFASKSTVLPSIEICLHFDAELVPWRDEALMPDTSSLLHHRRV